jgi:hypothetical protein
MLHHFFWKEKHQEEKEAEKPPLISDKRQPVIARRPSYRSNIRRNAKRHF